MRALFVHHLFHHSREWFHKPQVGMPESPCHSLIRASEGIGALTCAYCLSMNTFDSSIPPLGYSTIRANGSISRTLAYGNIFCHSLVRTNERMTNRVRCEQSYFLSRTNQGIEPVSKITYKIHGRCESDFSATNRNGSVSTYLDTPQSAPTVLARKIRLSLGHYF